MNNNVKLLPGEELPELVKGAVTKVQIARYAGASGDFNSIHLDDEIGLAQGTGGIIAHGMLVMGFVGEAITNWFPKHTLRKFGVRFVGMTRPGNIITIRGIVKEIQKMDDEYRVNCVVTAKDQLGELKVVGSCEVEIPGDKAVFIQDI